MSIIAVVSLIHGHERLRRRHHRVGGGRRQLHHPAAGRGSQEDDDFARAPELPPHHAGRRQGGPALQRQHHGRGGAGQRQRARSPTARWRSLRFQVRGVSRRTISSSQTFDAEHGRLISSERDRSRTSTSPCSAATTAERLFGAAQPLDKVIRIGGLNFPGRRRQREEGIVFRPVTGRVRADPARCVPEDVRLASGRCR